MSPTAAGAKHGSFVSRARLAVTLLRITTAGSSFSVTPSFAGKALKVSHDPSLAAISKARAGC